jgi:hypothetical protein
MKRQMQYAAANLEKVQSPISITVDLASLSRSDDPTKRQMADILSGISELKSILRTSLAPPKPSDTSDTNERDLAEWIKRYRYEPSLVLDPSTLAPQNTTKVDGAAATAGLNLSKPEPNIQKT